MDNLEILLSLTRLAAFDFDDFKHEVAFAFEIHCFPAANFYVAELY